MELVDLLEPSVLMHPSIPKPLHEVNPRNIMGKAKWDILRQQVYASTDYHCIACGVAKAEAKGFKWLEAHEFYDIDYHKGTVTIKQIIPLCHYCHNFIHSGRLKMIMGKKKSVEEVVAILQHGFDILAENSLRCFYPTLIFAQQLEDFAYINTHNVQPYDVSGSSVKWEDWRLIWDGVEYPPKYKSYEEWQERYMR